MLLGIEQAVKVEPGRPLVPGLKDCLCVIQPDLPDVLGELTVGPCQVPRGGVQPPVRQVDLLDARIAGHQRLLSSDITFLSPSLSLSLVAGNIESLVRVRE